MSASGYTPIIIYNSGTATNAPIAGNLASGELAINYADGKLFFKNSSNVITVLATSAAASGNFPTFTLGSGTITTVTNNTSFTSTGAITLPVGTTAQEPTGVAGMLRFNSTTTQFEGYNGSAWASVGGAAISNDTTTASTEYPLFASATSGTALTVYTSNAKLLYKPSTGEFSSSELIASNGLVLNNATVAASYTIQTGQNAMSVGPITVASGQSVTVSSGQRWVIL
jgi:hypothetical protein